MVPLGTRPEDLTFADSLTLAPTQADVGLVDTVVVDGCFLTACAAAVAALAGRAHNAHVAVATAVTDTSRTTLICLFPLIPLG
jgi:hypothetical protein